MNKNIKKLCILEGGASFQPKAWLRVTGEDALSFLQGQFTQELREGKSPAVNYGWWLNQKGKVLADSWVLRVSANECWIWSAFSPAATIQARLEAFIIADDVVIEDLTEEFGGLVLAGTEGRARIEAAGIDAPAAGAWSGGPSTGWVFRTERGAPDTWEWVFSSSGPNAEAGMPRFDAMDLERARIAAGVPCVPEDIGPEDLPNEGGREAQAISYTKGCYLGQEVVARLKSLGRARRRLVAVAGKGARPPDADRALMLDGQVVGELRSRIAVGDAWIGFAMIKSVLAEGGDFAGVQDESGSPVWQRELG